LAKTSSGQIGLGKERLTNGKQRRRPEPAVEAAPARVLKIKVDHVHQEQAA